MKILFLTTHLNIGGISSYILSLGSGLRKRGHAVFVASSGGELCDSLRECNIGFLRIPINTKSEINLPKIVMSYSILRPFVKKNKIDVVHSHTRVTQVLGCMVGRYSHIPHVATCHGFFKNRLSRRLFPCWGERVIAISESVREHLIRDFGVEEKKISLVYNGIDTGKFSHFAAGARGDRAKRKKDAGLSEGPVVGIVARLSGVKGHRYLIEAMNLVIKKMPSAQLLIVGDGKMKGDLKTLTESLHIHKNVFFIPSVKDTAKVFSIMDLFVMPSLKEGLGLSLMEAMGFGLPVIGSDIGGIQNLIQNGTNGVLVKTGDSSALADSIMRLLTDKSKAESLGDNAQGFINREFSLEKMVSLTEAVYEQCIAARRSQGKSRVSGVGSRV